MTERIFATENVKECIEAELGAYRKSHAQHVRENHPRLSFLTLETLTNNPHYATLVSQVLLCNALSALAQRLSTYKPRSWFFWRLLS